MDNIYNSVIEALIFASDEPLTPPEIINSIKGIDGPDTEVSEDEIETAVAELNKKYEETGSAFTILRIAHGYSFATRPNHAKYVGFLSTEKSKRRLSNAALETLAIVAYKQPLTKPELEMIRGVNSDYTLNTLLEKNLVSISGRAETVGRPLLYATTDEFLKYFGLYSINDLPKPREIEEIMKDEDFLEQKRKIMMGGIEEEAEAEAELKKEDDDDEYTLPETDFSETGMVEINDSESLSGEINETVPENNDIANSTSSFEDDEKETKTEETDNNKEVSDEVNSESIDSSFDTDVQNENEITVDMKPEDNFHEENYDSTTDTDDQDKMEIIIDMNQEKYSDEGNPENLDSATDADDPDEIEIIVDTNPIEKIISIEENELETDNENENKTE